MILWIALTIIGIAAMVSLVGYALCQTAAHSDTLMEELLEKQKSGALDC